MIEVNIVLLLMLALSTLWTSGVWTSLLPCPSERCDTQFTNTMVFRLGLVRATRHHTLTIGHGFNHINNDVIEVKPNQILMERFDVAVDFRCEMFTLREIDN